MSQTLSAASAKKNFAESLRRAEAGEVVEITRYGKPVAALVGLEELEQIRRFRAAGPEAGLAGLVGKFPDGDVFHRLVEEVVGKRSEPRPIPSLGE